MCVLYNIDMYERERENNFKEEKTIKELRSGYFWGTDYNVRLTGTTLF